MADRERSDYGGGEDEMRYRDQEGRRPQYRPGDRPDFDYDRYGGQEYYEGSRGGRWDREAAYGGGGEYGRDDPGWQRRLGGGEWQRQQQWELEGGPSSGRWPESERRGRGGEYGRGYTGTRGEREGYAQYSEWRGPGSQSDYFSEYDPYAPRRGGPYGMEYPEAEWRSPGGYGQMYRRGEMGGRGGAVETAPFPYGERSRWLSGPYVGRGPRGYRRSDERIKEDIYERLTLHPEVDAEDIEVEVRDGEVTLTGSVMDRYQKRLAEDAIEGVLGVRDITNRLRVGTAGSSTTGVSGGEPGSEQSSPQSS